VGAPASVLGGDIVMDTQATGRLDPWVNRNVTIGA
jgi:hypothetical protein